MLPAACSYRFHQTPKYADVPETLHLSRSSVLSPLAVCSYMFPLHLGSHCYYDFHSQKVLQSFGACCLSPHHSLGNKTSHSADQEAPAKPPNKTIAPQSLSRSQTKALTSDRPRDASHNFKTLSLVLGLQCYHSSVLGLLYRILWFNNTELKSRQAQNHKRSYCSVAKSCLTLCNPIVCSTPGLPVHHQLPEFAQTHIH